jgi:hypothetical protein
MELFYRRTHSVEDCVKWFLGPSSLLRDEACSVRVTSLTPLFVLIRIETKKALVNLRYDRPPVCVIAPPTGRISVKFDVCGFYKNMSRRSRWGQPFKACWLRAAPPVEH